MGNKSNRVPTRIYTNTESEKHKQSYFSKQDNILNCSIGKKTYHPFSDYQKDLDGRKKQMRSKTHLTLYYDYGVGFKNKILYEKNNHYKKTDMEFIILKLKTGRRVPRIKEGYNGVIASLIRVK